MAIESRKTGGGRGNGGEERGEKAREGEKEGQVDRLLSTTNVSGTALGMFAHPVSFSPPSALAMYTR